MQPVAQMHQMVSGSLALLFIGLEFPEAWLAGPEAWLARPEAKQINIFDEKVRL